MGSRKFSGRHCDVWGDGDTKLPFVLVGDVASALLLSANVGGIEGNSYNLTDIPLLTAREYLAELEGAAKVSFSVRYNVIP